MLQESEPYIVLTGGGDTPTKTKPMRAYRISVNGTSVFRGTLEDALAFAHEVDESEPDAYVHVNETRTNKQIYHN